MDPSFANDDGRARRTGNVWTAFAHVITGVAGSGILSQIWMAEVGWVAAPLVLLFFAFITYYTAAWLADCYWFPDPVTGKRSYRYKDAVNAWLGQKQSFACAWLQYSNLFATAISCTITGGNWLEPPPGFVVSIPIFGAIQLVFSQIPNLDKLWWLSTIATIMSFVYSTLFLVLGIIAKLAVKGRIDESVTGVSQSDHPDKIWLVFQSLGGIAFSCSFSMILVEIQDTLRAPPAENKTMKRATLLAVIGITGLYSPMAIACHKYAAFGEYPPHGPQWMVGFLKAGVVIHMVGAYQVCSQPMFECLEAWVSKKWPNARFTRRRSVLSGWFSFTLFRLVWRSLFVIVITSIAWVMSAWVGESMKEWLALLRALAFWPLTVYFPVEMYIRQAHIKCWSGKWIGMELLSLSCLFISIAATIGSVQHIWEPEYSVGEFEDYGLI